MSIRERYDELRATQESEARKNQRTPEERAELLRRQRELVERRETEGPIERKKQLALLRELQELGVIGLIEEFTGQKLTLQEDVYGKTVYSIYGPREERAFRDIPPQVSNEPEWGFDIVEPHLSEDGVWNPNLVIRIGQAKDPYDFNYRGDTVLFTFTPEKEMEIRGREVVFRDRVTDVPFQIDRIGTLERAFARALVDPMPENQVLRALYPDIFTPRPIK